MSAPDTFPGLIAQAAQAYGDAPAVQWAGGTRSYRALTAETASLAKGLIAEGVGKGSRVAILAGNTWLTVRAIFACARVGAIAIPISTLSSAPELAHVLRHSDAQLLLAGRRYLNRDYGELIARALPSLAEVSGAGPLRLPEAPFLRSVRLDETHGLAWARSVNDLLRNAGADNALDDHFLAQLELQVTPSDDALIIYTSGSTALPKAVLHTQGPMLRQARLLAEVQVGFPGERILCASPLFWVGGMNILLEAVATGSCILFSDGVSPTAIADSLRELNAQALYGWPTQKEKIRDVMIARGENFEHIRPLRDERWPDGTPQTREQVPAMLGMTESFGPHGTLPAGTKLPDYRLGAYAPASGGFERRVVNPETGEILSAGQVGELQLRGGSLMKGYYKKERSEAFTPDGFFATSDLVRIEPDGFVYFVGRTGDMLKTNGANVSRLEVEAALRRAPGVAEAVVCGLPDPNAGQIVVAAVVPQDGVQPDEPAIRAALREDLAAYKVPAHFVFIRQDDLALTGSGKIRLTEVDKLVSMRLRDRA